VQLRDRRIVLVAVIVDAIIPHGLRPDRVQLHVDAGPLLRRGLVGVQGAGHGVHRYGRVGDTVGAAGQRRRSCFGPDHSPAPASTREHMARAIHACALHVMRINVVITAKTDEFARGGSRESEGV